uniref:Uncharacterized protein n=1 Tax=Zea mays TaxID=4577 RepID=A0A804NUB2_MAIZE
MSSKSDNGTNEQLVDEYYDQDEDDLGDFIVYSDDDDESLKHKQHQQEMEDEQQQEDEMEQQQQEDEMEEEIEEEVEVEEEEEAPVGQQEILSLREQLKEEIRRKNAAMVPSAHKPDLSSPSKNQTMPTVNDGYGTFFGPSKPVLARRVIEEGCSSSMMKDLQNIPSSKRDVSLASKMRPGAVQNVQKQKFVSEEKRKADTLRKNRDYSCLFSDDADTHPPTEGHPSSRASLALKSEAQDGGPVNARKGTAQPATLSLGKKAHAERKGTIASGRNSLPNNLKKKSPGIDSWPETAAAIAESSEAARQWTSATVARSTSTRSAHWSEQIGCAKREIEISTKTAHPFLRIQGLSWSRKVYSKKKEIQ